MTSHMNPAATMLRILLGGLTAVLLCAGAQADDNSRADYLLYKEALYHIYNNDHFKALNLLESTHTGATHIANKYHNLNHLLAVQSALHLGMYQQAKDILEHLDFTNREPAIREASQMYWGKLSYQQGRWQEAIDTLQKLGPEIPDEYRDEAYYYLAMSLMHQGLLQQATPVLARMSKASLWSAYGYYNLAMHYAERDADPSRALVALRVAGAMTNTSPEGQALNDQIHLSAGQLSLRAEDYGKAMTFLQKVRVRGEASPAAIYAYGLAYKGLGQHRAAVQMWHRAKKYALVIPGVAESFQAIAYGFERENLRTSALEAYVEAVAVYDKEMAHLDKLVSELQEKGAVEVLLESQAGQEADWFLLGDVITNTPKAGLVGYLMADESFYRRAKTVLELRALQKTLDQGESNLSIFRKMVETQRQKSDRSATTRTLKEKAAALNGLVNARNRLVQEIESAEKDKDYFRLAPPKVLAQKRNVEDLKAELRRLQQEGRGGKEVDLKLEKLQLLEGDLLWRAMSDFDANRQQARRHVAGLDEQLNLYREGLKRFNNRLNKDSGQSPSELDRIDKLRTRTAALSKQLQQLLNEESRVITTLAIERLQQHRTRMQDHRRQSQIALVNLLDDIAVRQVNRVARSGAETGGRL